MKKQQIIKVSLFLYILFNLTSCAAPSIESIVEESAINFDEKVLISLYENAPTEKLKINFNILKFWGARIDTLNYEELQSLNQKNNLIILNEKIEGRRLYLTSKIYGELKRLDFSEFNNFTLKNPKKIDLVNNFIENYIFPNKDKYTYNDLYILNEVIINNSDLKTEFETELSIREESIFNDIEQLSFSDLNKYYNNNKGNKIGIDNFLKSFVIPTIAEYNYFELKQIVPLLCFSSTIVDIEKITNEKRNDIITKVKGEYLAKTDNEWRAYTVFKEELKVSIDDYFYPSFEKFCDEYFDFTSDLFRVWAVFADFFTNGNRVERDFIKDWQTYISNKEIEKRVTDKGEILAHYIESMRKNTIEDLSLLIDKPLSLNTHSSITEFENMNFEAGKKISKNLAVKNSLTEVGSVAIESVAGFLTSGTSLMVTRGVSMVGTSAISIKNEDVAKEKFIDMYEKSMQAMNRKNDDIIYLNQKKSYNIFLQYFYENL